jgi:hypothetical protein
MVGEKLDGLRLAIFQNGEGTLAQIGDQTFLVVTHGEVNRNQVNLAFDRGGLFGFLLGVRGTQQHETSGYQDQNDQGLTNSDEHEQLLVECDGPGGLDARVETPSCRIRKSTDLQFRALGPD